MKKRLFLVIFACLALMLASGFGLFFTFKYGLPAKLLANFSSDKSQGQEASPSALTQDQKVRMQIGEKIYESTLLNDGTSILDLMQTVKKFSGVDFKVDMKTGRVTEINKMADDEAGNKYWRCVVNGKLLETPISSYILKGGDLVEWVY